MSYIFFKNLSFFLFLQITLNFFLIYFKNKNYFITFNKYSSNIQKIHSGFTPKYGGMIIYICLSLYVYISKDFDNTFLFHFVVCFFPIFLIIGYEDIRNNTHQSIRLFSLVVASYLLLTSEIISLPKINYPLLSNFLDDNHEIYLILIICSFVGIVNTLNFIDGVNGILSIVYFSIALPLYFLSITFSDTEISNVILIFSLFILVQFFFNYPYGSIFFGDLGAYICGGFLAFITIIVFSRNDEIITSLVFLIFIYPISEFLITTMRRSISRNSIFLPDMLHIHHLVLFFIKEKITTDIKLSNNLVIIFLLPLIILPFLIFISIDLSSYKSINYSVLFIFILYLAIYLYLYFMKTKSTLLDE